MLGKVLLKGYFYLSYFHIFHVFHSTVGGVVAVQEIPLPDIHISDMLVTVIMFCLYSLLLMFYAINMIFNIR